jgi:hypothetical protein
MRTYVNEFNGMFKHFLIHLHIITKLVIESRISKMYSTLKLKCNVIKKIKSILVYGNVFLKFLFY